MGEAAHRLYSFEEYLSIDEASELRHEYLDGCIFAMAGGTLEHSRLAVRIGGLLEKELGFSGPCRVYNGDARVRIPATGRAVYPDVFVVCGEGKLDPASPVTLTNPTIIVEVLSDGTEAEDRGDKFFHYQQLPSLEHYVLVDQYRRLIDHFRRAAGGGWQPERLLGRASLGLDACGIRLPLSDIYEGIVSEDAPLVRSRH